MKERLLNVSMKDIKALAHKFTEMIEAADSIGIVGHIRPDGDCVGSTLGLYNYILEQYPNKTVVVYLEAFSKDFMFLQGADKICHEPEDKVYDLSISLDCSDTLRHGPFAEIFRNGTHTVCIDHHISNAGFGELCYIDPEASSTCEAVCDLIEMDKMSEAAAACFYLGIVHDTGVFKYSCTKRKTMETAGHLIELGARPEQIIDETFYKKSYRQNLLMAKTILQSERYFEDRVICGLVTTEMFQEFQADRMDTDGIVEQLRLTDGAEVAVFVYQNKDSYKFSLRSKAYVDVSMIAAQFGGGGHVRAAGFEYTGDYQEGLNRVLSLIGEQLK